MSNQELKPCPLCRSDNVTSSMKLPDGWVECGDCDCEAPYKSWQSPRPTMPIERARGLTERIKFSRLVAEDGSHKAVRIGNQILRSEDLVALQAVMEEGDERD